MLRGKLLGELGGVCDLGGHEPGISPLSSEKGPAYRAGNIALVRRAHLPTLQPNSISSQGTLFLELETHARGFWPHVALVSC